jgi:hypothetical protein
VLAESIAASQVALLALTGSDVIAVFHTLSAGKTGHRVPGKMVPEVPEDACDDDVAGDWA